MTRGLIFLSLLQGSVRQKGLSRVQVMQNEDGAAVLVVDDDIVIAKVRLSWFGAAL